MKDYFRYIQPGPVETRYGDSVLHYYKYVDRKSKSTSKVHQTLL